jgi:alkanesulfonate monooxygenase
MDPLASLAWLGGQTSTIKLGTGVLVLPYRPKFMTARWVATVQELVGERLQLGVAIGWMKPEFDVVGVPLKKRVSVSEDTIAFLRECFANDVVELNGQKFLFKPRPAAPPILIGGAAPHATDRAARIGDGWLPMTTDPEKLEPAIRDYRARAKELGRTPRIFAFGALGKGRADVQDRLARLEEIGVETVITGVRYSDDASFSRGLDDLTGWIS